MPFYEYQCAACSAHHEELQKITDRPLRKCPACGKNMLRRLVSAPVFRLKGGGWYETDFKADKEQQRNLAGDKEPAASEAPVADKSKDAKPDPKADAKADAKAEAKTEGKSASKAEDKSATAAGETGGKQAESRSTASKTRTPTSRGRAKRQSRVRRGRRR
jgi:putative FmdB family regulatory protein